MNGVSDSTGTLQKPKYSFVLLRDQITRQPDLLRLDTNTAFKRVLVDISAWLPTFRALSNLEAGQSPASKHGMTPIVNHTHKSGSL